MIAVAWVSNVLGTVNPVHELVAHRPRARHADPDRRRPGGAAHPGRRAGAGLPTSSSSPATSSTGPPASACCYGKAEQLEAMPPYQGGGDMIERVSFAGTDLERDPVQVRGRHARHRRHRRPWAPRSTMSRRWAWTRSPRTRASCWPTPRARCNQIPGVRVIGTAREKCSVLTFAMDGVHPQDIGALLDLDGIAIRTGHHCAMPLHERFGLARQRPRLDRPLHQRTRTSTRSSPACRRVGGDAAMTEGAWPTDPAIERARRSWPTSRRRQAERERLAEVDAARRARSSRRCGRSTTPRSR